MATSDCCSKRFCAVPPHPDVLAKYQKKVLTAKKTGDTAAIRALQHVMPLGGGTGVIPGLNDGTIYPKSHYKKAVSVHTMALAALERTPMRGTVNVILVLVDFTDVKMAAGAKARFEKLFFSTGVIPTGSVKEYYEEVSGGKISIAGEAIGPFPLSNTEAYYAHGNFGYGWEYPNSQTMADEAVTAAMGKLPNYKKYDNDGNGYIDVFCVVHAGTGAETTSNPNQIWSIKSNLPAERTLGDTKVFGFLTIPEDSKIGVCAHEIGHLLFGWPDLYDTDNSSAGIGNWCLMSYGSWGGGGDRPVHPSAWCKANQGWIDVVVETENHTITLPDVKTSKKTHRLWKNGDAASQEYFLLENRQFHGFDNSMPSGGLLIWHIDDSQWGNTDERHPKVGLMQADGMLQLEDKTSYGDAGDPFPGLNNTKNFSATTVPSSKDYTGQDTYVSVTNIPGSSDSMTVNITVKPITPPAGPFDSKTWYRLTNTYQGYSLEALNDGSTTVVMKRTGNFPGQLWQIVSNGAGNYALRSLALSGANQLEVYAGDKLKPHMGAKTPFTGQIWKIGGWGDGTWHLENLYSGSSYYLDTMEGAERVAMNQANTGRPTERWNITPIRAITESGF